MARIISIGGFGPGDDKPLAACRGPPVKGFSLLPAPLPDKSSPADSARCGPSARTDARPGGSPHRTTRGNARRGARKARIGAAGKPIVTAPRAELPAVPRRIFSLSRDGSPSLVDLGGQPEPVPLAHGLTCTDPDNPKPSSAPALRGGTGQSRYALLLGCRLRGRTVPLE